MPSVEEARPGRCPRCEVASRPVGARLNLHGHGVRDRQLRGPLEPGQSAQLLGLSLRRYLCNRCGATITVGPSGLLCRRLFVAAAIGLALCLWGHDGLDAHKVRAKVNPLKYVSSYAARGWGQLRRWVRAQLGGRLFGGITLGEVRTPLRAVAHRIAVALSTLSPPQKFEQSMAVQVFLGAEQAL